MATKNEKIEIVKKVMFEMINDFEQDIIKRDNGKEEYLSFLDDVYEFIKWTGLKYTYRYDGVNTRVVKKGEIYYCPNYKFAQKVTCSCFFK